MDLIPAAFLIDPIVAATVGLVGLGGKLFYESVDKRMRDAEVHAESAQMQAVSAVTRADGLQCKNEALCLAVRVERLQKWALLGALGVGAWLWLYRYDDVAAWRSQLEAWQARLARAGSLLRAAASSRWHQLQWQAGHFEIGSMMHIDGPFGQLGHDFDLHVQDDELEAETIRTIRIQCTGVVQENVTVEVIHNGCVVYINRPSSPGLKAANWTKRIQFPSVEDVYEFKEDEMHLDHGILQLVFKSYRPQSRVVRLHSNHHVDIAPCIRVKQAVSSDATGESFVHVPLPSAAS